MSLQRGLRNRQLRPFVKAFDGRGSRDLVKHPRILRVNMDVCMGICLDRFSHLTVPDLARCVCVCVCALISSAAV